MASEYEPGFCAPWIAPTPLLMIVAENDIVAPADLAISAFNTAGEPKRLEVLKEAGHFDAHRGTHFDAASQAAREWFVAYL
jgi:uncharacterized protein